MTNPVIHADQETILPDLTGAELRRYRNRLKEAKAELMAAEINPLQALVE